MANTPNNGGKFRRKPCDFAEEEKLTRLKVYKEISKRTGYKETDIAKVIKTFHHVICDEFSSGKTIFTNIPFYTIYIQRVKGKTIKGFNGETIIVPDMDKVFFRAGSALNNAIGYVNRQSRAALKNAIKKGRK